MDEIARMLARAAGFDEQSDEFLHGFAPLPTNCPIPIINPPSWRS